MTTIYKHVYHVALQERLMEVEPELASNKDKIKVWLADNI